MSFEEALVDLGLFVKEREKGGKCRAESTILASQKADCITSCLLKVKIDKDTTAFRYPCFPKTIISALHYF